MRAAPIVITEDRIRAVLTFRELIPAMERALIDFSAGRLQQPVRTVLAVPQHGGWFGAMPAVCGELMGAKLVTFYPGNAARGLHTHLATIQLFRSSTGEPLAIMDGRLITEMRTAAVSAVATRLLAPPRPRVLALLGAGVQARSHLEALRLVRDFDEVRVWSRSSERAAQFALETGARVCSSVEETVRDADVVVTVTSAAEPILSGEWLSPGAYVNAVGAVGPARRELDDAVMQAGIVVESRAAAVSESGDIILSGAAVFAELGELLADGARKVPPGRVVFKSLGIAVEDIVAAGIVYNSVVRGEVVPGKV
jgi:ornithine cyclodeaminase/alanine dehydrogenase-like protein (mu-crystallin family)